ncbi:MAG: PQQ-dependent dehydrogenase, methanol/ethanol family, partial [Kangiella sp.]|nr:PQQ-dependent dehydrogenase, methanol/ethanol family [Kangiella sp.]
MPNFLREKWPVLVNAAAGIVLAVVVVSQFAGSDDAAVTADIPEATNMAEPAMPAEEDAAVSPPEGVAAVDGERIINADAEPGNWMSHGRTYSEQRYSPLDQINDENASRLGLAWSFSTGTVRGLEATPIVVDGTMFTTGHWGVVYA